MVARVLIVDDEAVNREALSDALQTEGYETAVAAGAEEALALLETEDFDLVLTDLRIPGIGGVALLRKIRQLRPQSFVILMTAHATIETAIEALHDGVNDYLLKPLILEEALAKIEGLLAGRDLTWQLQYLRSEVEERFDLNNFVGQSAAMKNIVALAEKVAPTQSTVLITGEGGVGKEVVARSVHRQSGRGRKIFLPINCGALPENLLESQLFGHARGAFTGATTAQTGLLPRAKGGTVFLDEIGELPLEMQVKLLRVLEEKKVIPVGATTPVDIDARIIAATNRDLEAMCAAGEFREDLYYRLAVFGIDIPPLRERREDIPVLVEFLIRRHNREMNRRFRGVENPAMRILSAAQWSGNVRELDNTIEHAMILGSGNWIRVDDLPWRISGKGRKNVVALRDLNSATRLFERSHIESVLEACEGDKRATADRLGISLSSLYRKLEAIVTGSD